MKRSGDKLELIVSTSKDLFWKHGFRRVTIEEVCRKANVSKMTFYKHFDNKIDLVKYILEGIYAEAMLNYKSIMNSDIPYNEKFEKTIQMKMDNTSEMSEEFLHDYMQSENKELTSHLVSMRNEQIKIILNDYIEAQTRGDIRKDIKPEFILYFLNHLFEMVKDPNLEKLYDQPQKMIMEVTRFFFYGIMGGEKVQE